MLSKLLRWARITKSGSDDSQFATQQVEYMGKVADSLIVFPYGLHGNVPADALALMFSVQDNPDNRASIAWTPKKRPKLKDGEVALYHPPSGSLLKWNEDGDLLIDNGSATLTLVGDTMTLNGNLQVIGDTDFTGKVRANGKVIDDTHGHTQGNDSNDDAEAPINGVT